MIHGIKDIDTLSALKSWKFVKLLSLSLIFHCESDKFSFYIYRTQESKFVIVIEFICKRTKIIVERVIVFKLSIFIVLKKLSSLSKQM